MSIELDEFSNSFKRYRDFRYEYEEFTEMINKEKGDLIEAHIDIELKKEEIQNQQKRIKKKSNKKSNKLMQKTKKKKPNFKN